MQLTKCGKDDVEDLRAFLAEADLTLHGLEKDSVHLWIERDSHSTVIGTTGYELTEDAQDALIRSVAVAADQRTRGKGTALARFALDQATRDGASKAWLFSRRSGPFWRGLGFEPADRDELAQTLADTQQVQLFAQTGQLEREVAWSRRLSEAPI